MYVTFLRGKKKKTGWSKKINKNKKQSTFLVK